MGCLNAAPVGKQKSCLPRTALQKLGKDTHCTVRRAQIAIAGEGPLIPGRDLGIAFSATWGMVQEQGKEGIILKFHEGVSFANTDT